MRVEAQYQDGTPFPIFAKKLLGRVLDLDSSCVVLNIGVGNGIHSWFFLEHGFHVTGVSLQSSSADHKNYKHIQERFEDAGIKDYADILWCSHTLEHIPDVGVFLRCCRFATKKNGWLCITVPSDGQDLLIDGHLTFWTPAHLIYNLVVAGWDCSQAQWLTDDRDISLMVRRKDTPCVKLNYDRGDLELLQPYFPVPLKHRDTNPWLPDNFRQEICDENSDHSERGEQQEFHQKPHNTR